MFVKKIIFLICLMVQVVFGGYPSTTLTCKTRAQQMYCQMKCGLESALCIHGDCFCLSLKLSGGKNIDHQPRGDEIRPDENIDDDENYIDSDELRGMISNSSPETSDSYYASRPTVRHHIAHFCPNLDIARECIRKCLVVGKPAFCGKDHVCYCGHQYSSHDDNSGTDAKEMYAQFKDLYTKYFGTDRDTIELDM